MEIQVINIERKPTIIQDDECNKFSNISLPKYTVSHKMHYPKLFVLSMHTVNKFIIFIGSQGKLKITIITYSMMMSKEFQMVDKLQNGCILALKMTKVIEMFAFR